MIAQLIASLATNPRMQQSMATPAAAAAVVPMARQLLARFEANGAPPDVIANGRAFLDSLDKWIAESNHAR